MRRVSYSGQCWFNALFQSVEHSIVNIERQVHPNHTCTKNLIYLPLPGKQRPWFCLNWFLEKYVVKFIVAKNSVIGLIGKTAEPESHNSREVMNQTNARMEWPINFEPDFIGFRTRILSSEKNTVICAKEYATNSGREQWRRWKILYINTAFTSPGECGSETH